MRLRQGFLDEGSALCKSGLQEVSVRIFTLLCLQEDVGFLLVG